MHKKRGQITIFIIIGIVLLASVAVFLYLRQERVGIQPSMVIPNEVLPVKNYIDLCLEMTAKDAVLLLGVQGGYIYLPPKINTNPNSYISLTPGTGSEGIKVPYWYYRGESRIPDIETMQEHISRYIDNNLPGCINNFTAFRDRFVIEEMGNMSTKTTISDDGVLITTDYPLSIRPTDMRSETVIVHFDSTLPVKLKRMHTFAKEIMKAENEQMFFEDLTLDLMALGPDIPFSDIAFTCQKLEWQQRDVEDKIKNLLYYNLPRIRFEDTNYQPFLAPMSVYEDLRGYTPEAIDAGIMPENVPADAYDYFHFFWDVSNEDYKDLDVGVMYSKDWNFDMYVRPSKNNVMKASFGKGMQQFLKFLCINIYHFTYDIIYPIEMVIVDPHAFSGTGFTFNFAFPVLINHNEGDRTDFGISIFETPDTDAGYCDERGDEEISIYAKNSRTLMDVKGVNITFNCMNTYYCPLGQTKLDAGSYRLRTALPRFCSPGSIEAERKGYVKVAKDIVPGEDVMDLYLVPLKSMNFDVKKQRITGGFLQDPEPLEPGEKAVIYLNTNSVEKFDTYRQFPFDADTPDEFKTIDLILNDTTYELNIVLLDKNDKVIGGFRGEWKPNLKDIIAAGTVSFRVIEKIPHPVTMEEQTSLIAELENPQYRRIIKHVLQ